MSPTSRRIFLYWLLLLVPTLIVGGGAIILLRREQARLAERGAYADEARRAALAARARLIVENVELLVGDVQTGLLDVLAAEPAEGLDSFLERWEKTNPLVRTAFRSSADGRVLRPDARTAGEDARGFLRRFGRHVGGRPPWVVAALAPSAAPEKREQPKAFNEPVARKDVGANVAQWQSARRDVQELFKNQNSYAANSRPPAAAAAPAPVASGALADAAASNERPTRARSGESDRLAAATVPAREQLRIAQSGVSVASRQEGKEMKLSEATPVSAAKDTPPDRRGWVPVAVEGRLQLFGWLQPGGAGDVRGVEVDLAALVSRLGGALPAELSAGEGYALHDDQGRVLHQAGALARTSAAVIRVPIAVALLPGWDVTAYVLPAPADAGSGGFLWVSVLLVAIFVAAILAGGSLLLLQARRSEEEAAQKTSFVANVSLEFKTPLTTIRLYSELLEQGRVRDAAQGGEYLRTIGRETQRLARLVNNALDFSRLEQGRKQYAREPVDLVVELGRLLDTHAPRVAEAGLVLHRELPAGPWPVTTDRDALGQIVLNLIDNACKYAAEGGEVSVSVASRAGGGAEVRVADRGPGVPAEHRERICEKFHRVDDTLIAEKTGAGLGLSIARQRARGLGGDLRYAPRTGAGAEFILELP
ncbi:MAG: sensor histidine kinase [Opitutus sp.]|nr:sensor histidine kinase [Opitutus sp.]